MLTLNNEKAVRKNNIFFVFVILAVLLSCNKKIETRNKIAENGDIFENDLSTKQTNQINEAIEKVYVKNNDELDAISYIDYPSRIINFGENYSIEKWTNGTYKSETIFGKYSLEYREDVLFIQILWEDNTFEEFLILVSNHMCYLYRNNSDPYFRGYKLRGGAPGESSFAGNGNTIVSSAYLIENQIHYSTDNLDERIGQCWAVKGYGINETLSLKMAQINSISISIGFISFDNPYLWKENSRPKTVELAVKDKFIFLFELQDIPSYQVINLPVELENDDTLVIKIIDVYEGTKYEDVCINSIVLNWGNY
jgi:hypothetical protein